MRTTLDIDDDVLAAVKSLSAQRKQPMGKVMTELVRKSLAPRKPARMRNGVPVFEIAPGASPVTMELVNELRDGDHES